MNKEIVREAYDGDIEIYHWPDKNSHRYKINGEWHKASPSQVTGMLAKPGLRFWAAGVVADKLIELKRNKGSVTIDEIDNHRYAFKQESKEAKDKGTKVHEWIEEYVASTMEEDKEAPDLPEGDEIRNAILGFLKWVEQKEVKFVYSEYLVYSREHEYVGKLDVAFTMGVEDHEILHLGDFKTSKIKDKPYYDHRYQLAGYQKAFLEEKAEELGERALIYCGKDTADFKVFWLDEFEKDFEVFEGLLKAYLREKELDKKYKNE